MSKKIEPRPTFGGEIRVLRGDSGPKIAGYAAVFDSPSEDLGGFVETIAPGAFKKALKRSDVRALWNHNPDYVLGRTTSGTLRLKEDKRGLFMEIDPPDTAFARDLMTLIERGDISQQSFGFTIAKEAWEFSDDEKSPARRTLVEIDRLYDVSPVTFPAYPDTSVSLRLLDAARGALRRNDGNGETADVEPAETGSNTRELFLRIDNYTKKFS